MVTTVQKMWKTINDVRMEMLENNVETTNQKRPKQDPETNKTGTVSRHKTQGLCVGYGQEPHNLYVR